MDYYKDKYYKYKNKYLQLKGGLVCNIDRKYKLCRLFDELENIVSKSIIELKCMLKDFQKISKDNIFLKNFEDLVNNIPKLETTLLNQKYLEYYIDNYMNVIHYIVDNLYEFYNNNKIKLEKHKYVKVVRELPCDTTITNNSFQLFILQKLTKIELLFSEINKNSSRSLSKLMNFEKKYINHIITKINESMPKK